MTTLFVGQRVRVVRAPLYPELVGHETRITRRCPPCRQNWEWVVSTPVGELGACSEHLEPIINPGDLASTYTFHELMDECRQVTA